ncbi:MAG: peptidase U32 family protein [Anaerorhabdus sp.]
MRKNIELLAPAGDLERAKIAIRFGADAIYLGGKKYSLRSRASNFGIEEIKEVCEYAKEYGSSVHVTVNMIPHQSDFDGFKEYVKELEDAGVTALIVASEAMIKMIKDVSTKLEIHLSTQRTTTNSKAIEYYQRLGVDRVVLARECTIDDVKDIVNNTSVELECFIHGGMCSNYSGRCTLSNMMTLRDANRGGCAQSCRWKYHLYQGDRELSKEDCLFSMSSKDMMALEVIYDLMMLNISSLKIEGRMKSGYYVASVVSAYRKLIDEIKDSEKALSEERLAYYQKEFQKAENRPTSIGFYHGEPKASSHLYGVNGAGVTHLFVGVILNYNKNDQIALIEVRNVIRAEETLEVFGPNCDNKHFKIEKMFNEDLEIIELANQPMRKITCCIPFDVEVGDMIRRVLK